MDRTLPEPQAATPQAAPSRPAYPTSYKVVAGDTLSGIAARFHVDIYNLARANRMNLYDILLVGRVLTLPDPKAAPGAPMPWTDPTAAPAPQTVSIVVQPKTEHASSAPAVSAASYGGGWTYPWACIAHYESGGNPAENTGNGYWGGLQFAPSTWWAYARPMGINVPAYEASIGEQEAVADKVLAAGGWGQWPNTSRDCGYR